MPHLIPIRVAGEMNFFVDKGLQDAIFCQPIDLPGLVGEGYNEVWDSGHTIRKVGQIDALLRLARLRVKNLNNYDPILRACFGLIGTWVC